MEDNTDGRSFGEVEERELPEDQSDDEQVETTSQEDQEGASQQTDNQESEEESEDQTGGDGSQQPKLTEKGTKEDANPLSAAHQNLANERKIRGQMEQVLANPKLIAQFVKEQYGIDMPVPGAETQNRAQGNATTQTATTKKWTDKDFESLQDVADKFNGLQETFTQEIAARDKKIDDLNKQVNGVLTTGRMTQIADTTTADVSILKREPELNPKSPDFIPGLEEEIVKQYHGLDYDPETGLFRGKYSLRTIANQFLNIARSAKKAGVDRGQTIVKDRTAGKIRGGGPTKETANEDSLSAGASIAKGIARMFK